MQITRDQGRAAQDIQERLFQLYLKARSNNLVVANDIKDLAENLSGIIAESLSIEM